MSKTARLAAAALVAGMALGGATLPADASVAKSATQQRADNPNHVLPTPEAEAWWVYSHEITDGCWQDFSRAYLGMQTADEPNPLNQDDDDSYMVLDSVLHPGFVFIWGPYDNTCN